MPLSLLRLWAPRPSGGPLCPQAPPGRPLAFPVPCVLHPAWGQGRESPCASQERLGQPVRAMCTPACWPSAWAQPSSAIGKKLVFVRFRVPFSASAARQDCLPPCFADEAGFLHFRHRLSGSLPAQVPQALGGKAALLGGLPRALCVLGHGLSFRPPDPPRAPLQTEGGPRPVTGTPVSVDSPPSSTRAAPVHPPGPKEMPSSSPPALTPRGCGSVGAARG